MSKFHTRRGRLKIFLTVCVILIAIFVAAAVVIRHVYNNNLQPVSASQAQQLVTINSGTSVNQIADLLHKDGLIRSAWAFEWYVRSHEVRSELQAGTYSFAPSQTTGEVVSILTQGKIQTNLVTVLPGKRLDQIRATLINDGFSPSSVDAALQPDQYADLPALADKPAGASLEGLLYPDSFEKAADTDPSLIIRESLTEMGQKLTPDLQAAFTAEGLTTYQGIILASIVQQEVSSPSDQAQVAQVFLSRLHTNPPMPLASNVTAYYGAILAGQPPSINYTSPYNTYQITGLPPTPISTVSQDALNAVAHPSATDWLYFVTGDNGTTYFEQTAQAHQSDVDAYCHTKCAQSGQ
jgi:UPF0755 protein